MGKIPLACADFSFPLAPHELALDMIASLGIEGVDISLMPGNAHLNVEKALAKPQPAARQLSGKLAQRGLQLADINFTPGPDFRTLALNHPRPDDRSESRERFRRALEFCVECHAPHMTILPGVHWEDEEYEASFDRCVQELSWRLEQAAKAGVVVSVEAHLGSVVPTPEAAWRLLNLVPGSTLTLDYTHFIYQGFSASDCESLLRRASHFHARGARKGRLQASLKTSTIDYGRVLRSMKEIGYSGYFAIEYVWIEWGHCNETDNLSETILLRDLANDYR